MIKNTGFCLFNTLIIIVASCGFSYADNPGSFNGLNTPAKSSVSLLPETAEGSKIDYAYLKKLYLAGKAQEAITQSIVYLQAHPTDSDVLLLLGKLYLENKEYQKAREQLLIARHQTPNDVDVSLVLINADMSLFNYQEALDVVNTSLSLKPNNQDLLKKKSDIMAALSAEKKTITETNKQQGLQSEAKPTAKIPNINNGSIPEYKTIDVLYASGQHLKAIDNAVAYLKEHPADSDTRLVLGKLYYKEENYSKAKKELTEILKNNPNYLDARLILINIEITEHNYQDALSITNAGLQLDKNNKVLLTKVNDIKSITVAKAHKKAHKKIIKNIKEVKKTEEKKYHREIGIYQQQYYISDLKKVWDYSTLYYGQDTPIGKVYGKINYANRLGFQAAQGEVEAYPRLTKNIYLDLDFAYADEPNLFPSQVYGVEAYVSLDKAFDFSLGAKYNNIDSQHYFTTYTGTLSKLFKNNLVLFRPYYFVPGVGKTSLLYVLNLRHILRDPYLYFGCILGTGSSPDLADLTTINFIVVQNKIINPYINFPLLNERLIVNIAYLYQHQTFPGTLVRNWNGGTIGLSWKF